MKMTYTELVEPLMVQYTLGAQLKAYERKNDINFIGYTFKNNKEKSYLLDAIENLEKNFPS